MEKENIYFAGDKPDCSACFFYAKNRGCVLGGLSQCYYRVPQPEKKESRCTGCPYGVGRPCIGFCMVDLLNDKGGKK